MGPALHGPTRRLHHRTGQSIPPLDDIPRPSSKRLDPTGSNNRHRQNEFAASSRTDQPLGKTLSSVEEVPEGLTSPDSRPHDRCEHHIFSGERNLRRRRSETHQRSGGIQNNTPPGLQKSQI